MSVVDAFGQKKKHKTMTSTWGHLYPEPGKYPATFYVATGEYGDTSILGVDYKYAGNPLDQFIFPQVMDLVSPQDEPIVYKIECELWFFKKCRDAYLGEDVGKPIKPNISVVWRNT